MQNIRDTIQQQLNDSRRELLDLSSRNRLISMPIGSTHARMVEVYDEKGDETFKKPGKKALVLSPGTDRKTGRA